MSVLKNKRTTSKAEFVNTANEIYTETINFLSRLSARYSRLLAEPTIKMAAELVSYTEKAQSYFTSNDIRLDLRERDLLQARGALMALDVQLYQCLQDHTSQKVADTINAWVGATKGSAKHLDILEVYNNYRPLARGYKVQVKDAYCATTVSAAYIRAGIAKYTGTECGVEKYTIVAKKLGIWVENDAHTPKIGDACVYDWQDNGVGDCTGAGDHIGIVTKVSAGSFVVTEGNMSGGKVGKRTMAINGRYIRGFIWRC